MLREWIGCRRKDSESSERQTFAGKTVIWRDLELPRRLRCNGASGRRMFVCVELGMVRSWDSWVREWWAGIGTTRPDVVIVGDDRRGEDRRGRMTTSMRTALWPRHQGEGRGKKGAL